MFPNYYERLGLTKSATKEDIKRAYRKLALEYHPDKNKRPDAHEKFIEVNEAYLLLYDDEARAKYDREYEEYYYRVAEDSYPRWDEEERKDEPSEHYEQVFDDIDLNKWAKNAKEQGAEYAEMAFEEFSKMVIGFVKETGFQLGNTFLVFFGIMFTMGGCGNLVFGLSSQGEIGNPIIGIIFLPIGVLLWWLANRNWENHK